MSDLTWLVIQLVIDVVVLGATLTAAIITGIPLLWFLLAFWTFVAIWGLG